MSENSNAGKEKKSLSLKPFGEHDTNPFIEDLLTKEIEPRKKDLKQLKKTVDTDGIEYVVEASSGYAEFFWHDARSYNKVFGEYVEVLRGLSNPAQQMFWYILKNLPINKDIVFVKPADFMEWAKTEARSQYYVAAFELCDKKIIIPCKGKFAYFINPCVIFNGNVASILPSPGIKWLEKMRVENNKTIQERALETKQKDRKKKMDAIQRRLKNGDNKKRGS